MEDKEEFNRTGVTKKVRNQIESFVVDEKNISTVHFRTSEKEYVVDMIEKHQKQQLYGNLLEYLKKDIAEHRKFEENAALLKTGHKCTNIYCNCAQKTEN